MPCKPIGVGLASTRAHAHVTLTDSNAMESNPGNTKQPHQYFAEAMEHLAANPEGCQCKPIPACVAHYALQAMHNELVVAPYLASQRKWWPRLKAWFREMHREPTYEEWVQSQW
jgi:hypothetical protein